MPIRVNMPALMRLFFGRHSWLPLMTGHPFWEATFDQHLGWLLVRGFTVYVVHPKNYENKYTTIQCTKLYSPRFGLSTFCMSTFLVGRCFGISTFWFGLVCRCFGLSMFWSVDVSVCRRFGLLMFWYVDVSVCRRFGCRRFGLSTFWPVTYKRVHFDTPNPVYKYGHHFADDISEWISSMTFFIISLSLSFTS